MDKFYTILLMVQMGSLSIFGQDAIHSQFMFDDLSVNPGHAGINDYHKITVGFRDQWPGLKNAFVSYFASYDQKIPDINSGAGIQVFRDISAGRFSRTSAELFYSYHIKVNRNLTLSPGLQAAVVQRTIRTSDLTLPDDNPYSGYVSSEILSDRSSLFPDFGCGIVATLSDRYSAGIAAHHLNAPVETLSDINQNRTPLSLSAHFISYFPLRFGKFDNEKIIFSPGFYFKQQQYQNIFSVGLNIAYNPFFIGVWSRSASKITPQSVIFLAGVEQNSFRIVYSYDSKIFHADFAGTGAHEVTLVWKMIPKKKMKTIKCSKFSL